MAVSASASGLGKEGEGETETSIPLIPLEPLLSSSPSSSATSATTSEQKSATAKALLSAFHNYGFLYLTSYSTLIPPELVARVFAQSAHFFALPLPTKEKVAWTTPRANRGYTCMGKEKVSNGMTREEVEKSIAEEGGDLKESFEIGREGEEGYPNRWWKSDHVNGSGDGDSTNAPTAASEFKATMTEFFDRCKEVHRVLMRGIAIALDLHEDHFDGFVKTGDNTLRLLHYPPVAPGGFAGGKRVRAGAHSDYGTLTLLFQDSRGGLQIDPPASAKSSGRWIDVVPIEGAIVVNAGDLLARWSNDLIRSTAHRVVEPPSTTSSGDTADTGHPARYSVAYFCHPDFDRWIEAIPGTGESKYEGVNSGEYVVKRLSATY